LERNPAQAGLYVLRGEALLQNKQFVEAEKALARAVEIDKQNVNAFVLLAQVEIAQGSTDQAISNYKRAIEVAPNTVQLYVALGSIYEKQGNWQAAQPVYQKALAIEPDNPVAANNLAYIMLEHGGSVNVALTLAQTARRGLPNLANSADTLAWAYFRNGAFSVAAPLLEDAVKKAPDNSSYRYHLGLTYQNLKDSARARVELEKAISIDPKSPIAEEARGALSRMTAPAPVPRSSKKTISESIEKYGAQMAME
jgi:Tfp pilus assembly protein PilF